MGEMKMENRKGIVVLLIMCLGIFVCMLDSTIMNITLPAIQEDLHITLETSSWMLNIYTMTIAILVIPMARFADLFGKNKFYIVGLLLFGIGSTLCGLSHDGSSLIISRFIQSLGASILIPCSMVIGVAAMPTEKRVISLTLLGATQGLSTALGPTVGGIITQHFSWNWVFFVNVPVCIAAVICSLFILTLKREQRVHAKIDWLGLVFSSIAIFSLNLVLIKGNEWGWGGSRAIVCFVAVIISIALFTLTELKIKAPMVNMKLFKDHIFVGSALSVSTGFIFLVGVMVLLPQFLTRFQGRTEFEAAMLITPVSATIFIFSTIAGLVVKKLGYAIPTITGFLIMGSAYYFLHGINIHSSSRSIVILCVLLGLGFSFVISSATMASASSFEGEMLTAAQSVFSMIRQIGVVLAVAIFVSSLTNSIQTKKTDVLHYAAIQIQKLDVPEDVKAKVYQKTNAAIQHETSSGKTASISKLERSQLIHANVEKAMQVIPEKDREASRKIITEKVTKNVDQQISTISKSVNGYTTKMTSYSKKSFASCFAKVYKFSFPFVILSALLGIIYEKRGRRRVQSGKVVFKV
jgi:EmrB/QacA subfamily drug resistance transporter